jgi:hypothetical protein
MKTDILLIDDDYEKTWVSEEWHNGDFNLRLATRVMYLDEWDDEITKNGKYSITILAVSPEAVGKDRIGDAIDYLGYDEHVITDTELGYTRYEVLLQYGIYATLWGKQGNNLKKLLSEAKKEVNNIHTMFGFYMDKPENLIGNNGWDFIRGNIGVYQDA